MKNLEKKLPNDKLEASNNSNYSKKRLVYVGTRIGGEWTIKAANDFSIYLPRYVRKMSVDGFYKENERVRTLH
tara:strand:- start:6083 stop:6301 length:219 start_codon:yes stop_codon:yes gene_type:complete